MGQQSDFFEALGSNQQAGTPGFFTHSTQIAYGADIEGNLIGIKGKCSGPVGDGVQGYGSGVYSGVAGFGGTGDTGDGTGVFGSGGGNNGPGIRGIGAHARNTNPLDGNPSNPLQPSPTNNVGVYGQGGAGYFNLGAPGVYGIGGMGTDNGNQGAPGVVGIGNPGISAIYDFPLSGAPGAPFPSPTGGPIGQNSQNSGYDGAVGVYGQGAWLSDGVQGVVDTGEQLSPTLITDGPVWAGVHGISRGWQGIGVWGEAMPGPNAGFQSLAGYFSGEVQIGNSSQSASLNIYGDLNVIGGSKSAVVPFPDGSMRRLYAMECPENWFEDFGSGHFLNGHADISLADDFASVVNSDSYHVFLTEYEANNALYVTARTSKGFVVRCMSSTASGTFSYRVVAKRKDIAGPRFEEVEVPRENLRIAR
jgi:hypothetical protein